jgi:hypothetical protein
MARLALVFVLFQVTQPPNVIRGYDFEITVPHGWKALEANANVSRLEHSSGATLLVTKSRPTEEFDRYTRRAVERLANPLGFARIGEPRRFRDSNQEWVEYDVRGNRLAERRRILYRAIRNESGLTEIVYENSEDRFDVLLSEALSIASSLKSIPRKVRVRK